MTAKMNCCVTCGCKMEKEVNKQKEEKSLHEIINEIVFELYCLSGSLGTVGDLMLGAEVKCDSVAVGEIVEHYTGLITDGLGRIEESLAADMRRKDDA